MEFLLPQQMSISDLLPCAEVCPPDIQYLHKVYYLQLNCQKKSSMHTVKSDIRRERVVPYEIIFYFLHLHWFSFLWRERPWQEASHVAWTCRIRGAPCTTWRCTGCGCPGSSCTPGPRCPRPGHNGGSAGLSWRDHPILKYMHCL